MKNRLLVHRPAQRAAFKKHVARSVELGRIADLSQNGSRFVLGEVVQLGHLRGEIFELVNGDHCLSKPSVFSMSLSTGNGGHLE